MLETILRRFGGVSIDWVLVVAILPLLGAGLITMNSFTSDSYYFTRQLIWITASLSTFLFFSFVDWRILRRTEVVASLYLAGCLALLVVFLFGQATRSAYSWFSVGGVSLQPAEFMKLILVIMLAKYFTRRHVEIAHIRHILVSGLYAFIPFVLIFIQPDFGSAVIIFFIWLGMTMVAGISKKHLAVVFGLGVISFVMLWGFVLADYQKNRIKTFVNPLSDIQGAGYNAFQSTVAVGSGQVLGKGVGFGSQSRLKFLPEFQTDFVFAAFAEEWGFVGVMIVFCLFGTVIWRILGAGLVGATNFETLFAIGLSIILMSHFVIHVGMNIGVLPVTGLPISFMSYGGSHMLTIFAGLGILMGMRRYRLAYHRGDIHNEFVGPR
ncbi:MAG: rod shape-determining protein RodA [Candidatus Vogelbacteria bacterium]|nr:rod shape-determining protein RodA [Candidatus Vogelbacteria bacterium]